MNLMESFGWFFFLFFLKKSSSRSNLWNSEKVFPKQVRNTQGRMLPLIIQRERRRKVRKNLSEDEVCNDEGSRKTCESENENSRTDGHDQDSNPSFETETESGSNQDEEDEDWVEDMKRSNREAGEKDADIQNSCVVSQRKLQRRQGMKVVAESNPWSWPKARIVKALQL